MDDDFEPMSTRDYLGWRAPDLLGQLEEVGPEQRARCAETVASELLTAGHGDLDSLVDALGTMPQPSVCGVLIAASLLVGGADSVRLARRAERMRSDLPPHDWFDHIGVAAPTGRAARDETFDDLVTWLIELDDGLHRYCLLTAVELERDILRWVGIARSLPDEGVVREDQVLREVPLGTAVAGVREALAKPPMWGVTTTHEYFGLWARWRLWQLDRPGLAGPEPVDWADVARPNGKARLRSAERADA